MKELIVLYREKIHIGIFIYFRYIFHYISMLYSMKYLLEAK